ncbi:hypothetical protein MPSEU_000671300 [Mayamaea pseudoterrestris]|nr:hypothetical protein MPSEU_000671300 [Mayamaea pseudoterrestris]
MAKGTIGRTPYSFAKQSLPAMIRFASPTEHIGHVDPSVAFQDHPASINIDPQIRTRVLPDDDDETDEAGSKKRLVVVRYFLDRPGYGLHNSAARLWFHPPAQVTPSDLLDFLLHQEIAQTNLLIEVHLDKFQSFMLLEACQSALIVWDFASASYEHPGVLNVRLTDVSPVARQAAMQALTTAAAAATTTPTTLQHANTTPIGLFSFCIMAGLESTALLSTMFGDSAISPTFFLSYGPFMLFFGGILQFTVATLQVFRNNIYGATAFYGFGCVWLASGVTQILELYFAVPGTRAHDILNSQDENSHSENDPVGKFIRTMFILSFVVALWIQTLSMNRLSSILILLLGVKLLFASLTGFFAPSMQYAQLVTGYLTSMFAFYVFLVEFTNNVYQRQVFDTYPWSKLHSPEEVFGAEGKIGTLHSQATRLRQAKYSSQPQRDPRAAMSSSQQQQQQQQQHGANNGNGGMESFTISEKEE